ncbi:MAG: MBL fold metallo-hydrolase, partial [Massilia sp.]
IYRACLRSRRTLVLDLYSAEVLQALASHGRIPQPDWSRIKIVITKRLAARYRRNGAGALVDKHAANGMSARALAATPSRWVCMIRASLIPDFKASGLRPSSDDAWCWSLWSGYLRRSGEQLTAWFESAAPPARHIHTSGHASVEDLKALAQAIAPRLMVPIHGTAWDEQADGFPTIRRLADGEPLNLA